MPSSEPFRLPAIARNQHGRGAYYENRRQHRVAPHAVGARQVGPPAAIDEDCGRREHVEEPLGKDGQLKELLKLAEKQQQNRREQSLHHAARWMAIGSAGWMCANWRKKSRSRAAAKGMRAPDMMVPFSATKMLSAMAAATKPAPRGPAITVSAATAGRSLRRNLRGGQDVLNGRVGGHEKHAHDEQPADQRDGQAALRLAHFAGNHGEVVPSVIGPERGDEREHEAAESAHCACGSVVEKLANEPEARGEAEPHHDQNQHAFENREHKLKVARPS